MNYPIVDLHCDLLSYLSYKSGRTPDDPQSLCSIPQLKQGNVTLQTLALYGPSERNSYTWGIDQIKWFQKLASQEDVSIYNGKIETPLHILPAFEGSGAFCDDLEPLNAALARLDAMHKQLGHIFYISLTWNGETRFGGGVGSKKGLTEDGVELLKWMDGKGIAVDFSHASDFLMDGIINALEKYNLEVPVMASHSNFRNVYDHPRNLPSAIAKEIIKRKGLIGLVLFSAFVDPNNLHTLLKHMQYGLELGGENTLAWGADFFCLHDFEQLKNKYKPNEIGLFHQIDDSGRFPELIKWIQGKQLFTDSILKKICHENALHFLSTSGK